MAPPIGLLLLSAVIEHINSIRENGPSDHEKPTHSPAKLPAKP
jgi:hypothetical protein